MTRETGRSDLFLRTRDSGTAIMAGRYDGPGDESALSDMDRLRAITRGSQRPYAQAYLAPPIFEADEGSIPAYDLANAKQRYGADRAVFTLEYALFDEGSRRDYQREAEREAQRLRDAGEQAFYYHGRRGSLVTLGLFPEGAVDAVTRRYAYEVDVLQRRYKFAMHNGARVERENGGFFPTKLVRVP